jgi:hypothetical protein
MYLKKNKVLKNVKVSLLIFFNSEFFYYNIQLFLLQNIKKMVPLFIIFATLELEMIKYIFILLH